VGDPAGSDPVPTSLAAIRREVNSANGQLYRHLALYLQVLRSVLQQRVDQACFQLVTGEHGARYLGLTQIERQRLHHRLKRLVTRCCSLLTVEQLEALALQMLRRRRLKAQQAAKPDDVFLREALADLYEALGNQDRSTAWRYSIRFRELQK